VRKRYFGYLLLFMSSITLAAVIAKNQLVEWGDSAGSNSSPQPITLAPNESLRSLSQNLAARGIVSHQELFWAFMKVQGNFRQFQAGDYLIPAGATPASIARAMTTGNIYRAVAAKITVPEGFTVLQVAQRLAANGIGTAASNLSLSSNSIFLASVGISGASLEGFLYPATYEFYTRLPTPEDALRAMVDKFWKMLPQGYETACREKGLTLREAVTFASLIEMETREDREKPLVAEVIWRRLRARDFLGIDAAIIYGIPNFQGDLTWRHLRDRSNPYNTRLHRGLPPGPIGSPNLSSLEAVLSPSDFGFYYYVVDSENPGTHHFSKTSEEHGLYVRKLVKTSPQKKNSSPSP
jgi:UPF0755 protein